ncbi:MAG TPA: helix-turn-helix transcriptional regulator [Bacteroidales bacterium]|nr:helix-turn-helix transcriptional regulator [Bacteroidales bacterium]
MRKLIRILLTEPAQLISEGLTGTVQRSGIRSHFVIVSSLEMMEERLSAENFEIVILNPLFIQLDTRKLLLLKGQHPGIRFIALQYAYFEPKVLDLFDSVIRVTDPPTTIFNTIKNLINDDRSEVQGVSQEILSERETEVLRLLATGMANKEIADKLNISPNTVITHRKNISQKTGIKSVSGLTIFAVAQKIVSIENFREKHE